MDRTSAITSQLTQIQSSLGGSMQVCVPVAFCQWTWLLRFAPHLTHISHPQVCASVFFNLIKVWPIWIPLAGYKLNPRRTSCLCALMLLRLTTWEWRQATGSPWNLPLTSPRQHKVSFSPHLNSRDASLFLTTSDIFSAIYFQALMQCGVCGWGGSLGAPGSGLAFMWSGPTWSGIWPGPAGPPSGSRELMCSQPGMPDIWSQTC